MKNIFTLLLFVALTFTAEAQTNLNDPLDPNDFSFFDETIALDEEKTAEELITDAELLFIDERPLDGRTKLLLALKKDPTQYRAHSMLAGYYLVHVGHFRLALRYIRQAMKLFKEKHGQPPYLGNELKSTHAHHLHVLSQARLNLDDYDGALRALDDYESHGYYQDWYPGSRAWILMKNGDLKEAIRVARLGLMAGAEIGRTLNILGILLSMTGEREQSLSIFRQAIAHEFSLGPYGQPATPLNNSGEVYREIFQEESAEKNWLKATSLPDGCEHVLPALNLATVQMERLDYSRAKKSMDNFESCVAQFPLRNGEEHRALVHLARGRIQSHTGNLDEGIKHLREANRKKQWFGKIGTDEEDLEAGLLTSLALSLEQKVARDDLLPPPNNTLYLRSKRFIDNIFLSIESWWLRRRVRRLLIDKLNFAEDLYVRNTDSMIEYGTLGSLLAGMPTHTLEKRIAYEKERDLRGPALNYYEAYLGENYLRNGKRKEGFKILRRVVRQLRMPADAALKTHLSLRMAKELNESSDEYRVLVEQAYFLNRAALPGYGIRLPVNFSSSNGTLQDLLEDSPFYVDNSYQSDFLLTYGFEGNEHSFRFSSRSGRTPGYTVSGGNPVEVLRKLADEVFRIAII